MKKLLFTLLMFAPMATFAQAKFAHFNSAEIMQAMPEMTAARADLEKLGKDYEADIKAAQDELQKKAADYEKEAATLPLNVKERREKELNDMYARIQQSVQDNQQAYAKKQQELLLPIQTKVLDAIKAIGKAEGYVYIIDVTSTTIPYINESLSTEITAKVKAKLNLK